jgi:hypothetical protein
MTNVFKQIFNVMTTESTDNYGRAERGRFGKGNPGRPPSSQNKVQADIREKLGNFLEGKLNDLEGVYGKLPDRDKGKFLLECISYFLPKSRELTVDVNPGENGSDLSKEDAKGLWHFVHHQQRQPITAEELAILERTNNVKLILISFPK